MPSDWGIGGSDRVISGGYVLGGGSMGNQQVAEQMLAEARDDVKHADQKASVLLAALGIGFGAVVAGQIEAGWDSATLTPHGQVLFWIGVVAAIVSVGSCALAVWPRYSVDDSPLYGITYWGHVAAFKRLSELEDALDEQDGPDERRTRHQLWRVSKLVLVKYRYVRCALAAGAASGLLLCFATVVVR